MNINNEKIVIVILVFIIFMLFSKKENFNNGHKNLTIVTAYFKINRTRNINYTQGRTKMATDSDGMYREWMKGILSYKGPMIIFTDKGTFNYIKNLRKGLRTRLIKTSLKNLEAYRYFKNNKLNEKNYNTMVWKENNNTDVNRDLYTIWNSKFSLLKQSVDMNPFNTKYFAWFDIGYVREPDKRLDVDWPDNKKLKILDDKLLFKIVYGGPSCNEGGGVAGNFIGCNKNNIHKVHKLFREQLKKRYKENKFAGNDQELYQDIRCAHPDLIKGVKGLDTDYWNHVEGKWFHMIPYFYDKVFKVKESFANMFL